MAVVPLNLGGLLDQGVINAPLARRVHRPSRERSCMGSVHIRGQKRMSPGLSPFWLWRVSHRIEPTSFSIRRMCLKLRAAI